MARSEEPSDPPPVRPRPIASAAPHTRASSRACRRSSARLKILNQEIPSLKLPSVWWRLATHLCQATSLDVVVEIGGQIFYFFFSGRTRWLHATVRHCTGHGIRSVSGCVNTCGLKMGPCDVGQLVLPGRVEMSVSQL